MDEPLSNLDAKLRVQTRAELVELQQRLEATVVYVTHDQVEAMTMGHRIAIMSDGVLQQVGTPQDVYDDAGEPVRRPLHRHAADEHAAGAGGGGGRRHRRGYPSRAPGITDPAARPRGPAAASTRPCRSSSHSVTSVT